MINLASWKCISLLILSACIGILNNLSPYVSVLRPAAVAHDDSRGERVHTSIKMIEDHYTKRLPKTIELYEEIAASYEERRDFRSRLAAIY